MITSLITLAIFALILWIVYYLIGKFVSGTPYEIVGIIFGLIFLVRALQIFGVSLG